MTFKELETLIASGEGAALELEDTTGQRAVACEALRVGNTPEPEIVAHLFGLYANLTRKGAV